MSLDTKGRHEYISELLGDLEDGQEISIQLTNGNRLDGVVADYSDEDVQLKVTEGFTDRIYHVHAVSITAIGLKPEPQ